jgi:hypothetical protein
LIKASKKPIINIRKIICYILGCNTVYSDWSLPTSRGKFADSLFREENGDRKRVPDYTVSYLGRQYSPLWGPQLSPTNIGFCVFSAHKYVKLNINSQVTCVSVFVLCRSMNMKSFNSENTGRMSTNFVYGTLTKVSGKFNSHFRLHPAQMGERSS